MTTLAPSLVSPNAVALPKPELAPVTIQMRCIISPFWFSLYLCNQKIMPSFLTTCVRLSPSLCLVVAFSGVKNIHKPSGFKLQCTQLPSSKKERPETKTLAARRQRSSRNPIVTTDERASSDQPFLVVQPGTTPPTLRAD